MVKVNGSLIAYLSLLYSSIKITRNVMHRIIAAGSSNQMNINLLSKIITADTQQAQTTHLQDGNILFPQQEYEK
jgi:hypothetical protein